MLIRRLKATHHHFRISTQAREARGPEGRQRLRLLSYNIQAGVATDRYPDYLLHGWKHVLPFRQRRRTLERIAQTVQGSDLVGLQEVDSGSLRSSFLNQVEQLAHLAEIPFWHHQVNRNLGHLGQFCNGLLSRYHPDGISEYPLPGFIPGRGALVARYGSDDAALAVVILHLSLGNRARQRQLKYIARQLDDFRHVIIMGDMNCPSHDLIDNLKLNRTRLREPFHGLNTFPSWQPKHNLDHILVSDSIDVDRVEVLDCRHSDHRPVAMEVVLPEGVRLHRYAQDSLPEARTA